ncbi:MAG: hypothetical protein QM778_25955 [Myxococcales bacterium]
MSAMRRLAGLLLLGHLLVAGCAPVGPVAASPAAASRALSASELYAAGMAFLAAQDLVRAEQYLASALHSGFDERTCVRALLSATVAASRLRSALLYAEPYLLRHPQDLALAQLVATLHLVLGELPQAEQELRRVLALHDQQPEAQYLLALVLERSGGSPSARREVMQTYLRLAPRGRHAAELRASLLTLGALEPVPASEPARSSRVRLRKGG